MPDPWKDVAEIFERLERAFPDSRAHAAILRSWILRAPGSPRYACPCCGQARPDAVGRPHAEHVSSVIGAVSVGERAALIALGPEPPMSRHDEVLAWVETRRRLLARPVEDLVFRRADWSIPPRALAAFFAETENRWLCGRCAGMCALLLDPAAAASTERVYADLQRALEGRLLSVVEEFRASAVVPFVGRGRCGFCRREEYGVQLPWFTIGDACIEQAASASLLAA